MDTQLTHAARMQLARSLRRRYQAASSRAKKLILNEFIAVSTTRSMRSTCSMQQTRPPRHDVAGYAPRFTTMPRNRR